MIRRKTILFGLLAVGTGYAVRKAWSLMDINDRVSFVISSFKIHDLTVPKNILDFAGYKAVLQVSIRVYNNSATQVNLQVSSLKALYQGKEIAFSVPDATATKIQPNTTFDKSIQLDVPFHAIKSANIPGEILINKELLNQFLKEHLSFVIVSTINGFTTTTQKSLNGTGLALSAGPRKVRNGSEFNKYFASPENQTIRLVRDGDVDEVVDLAIQIVRDHHMEASKIAQVLKGPTIRQTASNIFHFAYNYLQYRRDKPGVEQLRTPARSWYDGQVRHKQMGIESAGIDCDCYAIFCASILHCLGIPFKFRITKYYHRDYFQHIYLVIPGSDKNAEIIIDPVLDNFNYEKPYSQQKDDFNMASLYSVEGLNGMPIDMLNGYDGIDLTDIIQGRSFLQGLDGLEDVPDQEILDKTYAYLIQTRDAVMARPEIMKGYTSDVNSLTNMLNDAIKYWHTPMRDQVLERLIQYENLLEKTGVFKVGVQGIGGGLEGGFFKKVGSLVKKVGKAIVKAPVAIVKVAGKIAKPLVAPVLTAIVASNPITMALAPTAGMVTSSLVNKPKKAKTKPKNTTSVLPAQALSIEPKQSFVPSPQTQTSMSTTNQTDQPGFLARNKKTLLIGGGILLIGTAAYLLFKPSRQQGLLPKATANQKALAGLPASRKKKGKRSTSKNKTKGRKSLSGNKITRKRVTRRRVKRVTLR
jgi:hypothetical protein